MIFETKMKKDERYGWQADTEIDMGFVPASKYDAEGRRVMKINTSKCGKNQIVCRANVCIVRGSTISMELFGDFTKKLFAASGMGTEANIYKCHGQGLALAEAVVAEARDFYERKDGLITALRQSDTNNAAVSAAV